MGNVSFLFYTAMVSIGGDFSPLPPPAAYGNVWETYLVVTTGVASGREG